MPKANTSFHSVNPDTGAPVSVRRGEEVDRTDPRVEWFPWAWDAEVEMATSVPGEKRTTRKPAAKKKAAPKKK